MYHLGEIFSPLPDAIQAKLTIFFKICLLDCLQLVVHWVIVAQPDVLSGQDNLAVEVVSLCW